MLRLILLLSSFTLAACQTSNQTTLYDELGGHQGLSSLVAQITYNAHNDPRVSELFGETDDASFIEILTSHLCSITGGGCTYEGLEMSEAHSGMNISRAEFNYFVEVVEQSMDQKNISRSAQNRLLAVLIPFHSEVIKQ